MNVGAEAVHGDMPVRERRAILSAYDRGDVPVLLNPMILTEGVGLSDLLMRHSLPISSHKSTMIQMVGRACASSTRVGTLAASSVTAWCSISASAY